MSEEVKNKAPQILEAIKAARNILLCCHPSADADCVGGVLAMFHALTKLGKKVTALEGDSPPAQNLSHLPGFPRLLNKNYFQVKKEDFDLFITIDISSKAQISKKGEIHFPPKMKVVVVDHHVTNTLFGSINLVDETYVAASLIVYDLLKIWQLEITREIAICLLLGIYSDSGGFKYPPTNSDTFLAAAELVRIAPDFTNYIFDLENQQEKERIFFLALALSSVEEYFKGKVAISTVSFRELEKRAIAPSLTEKNEVANILKSSPSWMLGISFIEREKDIVSLSFRTRDSEKYDVSKLATNLGGGGHQAAAGANINLPFGQAKKFLLGKIKETYPDLGEP